MEIDVLIEAEGWAGLPLADWADAACAAALRGAGLDPAGFAVSILACDDTRIAALNAEFRGKPVPTNVLSWPAEDLSPGEIPCDPELGDIAIAHGICTREAAEQGKDLDAHVTHLMIHATLHLLGHDHLNDTDADAMEAIERAALAELGLPDPY